MRRASAIAFLLLLLGAGAGAVTVARAQDADALRGQVEAAQGEAESLGSEIRATQERVGGAEAEASAASAREREVSGLLENGQQRAAELAAEVEQTEAALRAEKRRLRRARRALGARLVAIYTSGSPSTASVVLGSSDIDDLTVRTQYLEAIERSDTELAVRVGQVRDSVRRDLKLVAELKRRIDAHNARLEAARTEIGAVRGRAESAAAELRSLSDSRSAALATLKSKIGGWVEDIEAVEAQEAAEAAAAAEAAEAAEGASQESAEETVGRWLGGPYSIPTYIVLCESGGNYGAVNPSSGAGGAYQILPSTWDLYGGQGDPQSAPKEEQDRIAAEIWADSGGSAWVCAG